jgi:hypothetical protein
MTTKRRTFIKREEYVDFMTEYNGREKYKQHEQTMIPGEEIRIWTPGHEQMRQ